MLGNHEQNPEVSKVDFELNDPKLFHMLTKSFKFDANQQLHQKLSF